MIHSRDDYKDVQDPSGKIPEDEPVFLIRGHDILAPIILTLYVELHKLMGSEDHSIREGIHKHIALMRSWQINKHKSKLADVPKET